MIKLYRLKPFSDIINCPKLNYKIILEDGKLLFSFFKSKEVTLEKVSSS